MFLSNRSNDVIAQRKINNGKYSADSADGSKKELFVSRVGG